MDNNTLANTGVSVVEALLKRAITKFEGLPIVKGQIPTIFRPTAEFEELLQLLYEALQILQESREIS